MYGSWPTLGVIPVDGVDSGTCRAAPRRSNLAQAQDPQRNPNQDLNQGITLAAWVLAGGASRRMGVDKALLPWQGGVLLDWVVRAAAIVSDRQPVILGGDRDRYGPVVSIACDWWPDPTPGAGPPQVLAAHWLATQTAIDRPDWVLVLACDLPYLTAEGLAAWRSQWLSPKPNQDQDPNQDLTTGSAGSLPVLAVVPRWDDRWQPLCGFYRPAVADSLVAWLAQGGRSFQGWLDGLADRGQVVAIDPDPVSAAMLTNCNRPEDWAKLNQRL